MPLSRRSFLVESTGFAAALTCGCAPDPNWPPAPVVRVQPERQVVDGVMTFPCGGGIANAGQEII
jgi:hypothetical protein